MNSTLKKVSIGVGVIAVLFFGYYFFSGSSTPDTSSGLMVQPGMEMSNTGMNEQIAKDTSFIATLLSLNKIQIDTSILQSTSFKSLDDNTVPIVNDGIVGRPNPFSPFEIAPADNSTILPSVTSISTSPSTNASVNNPVQGGQIKSN